jgi:hypothetical protein
MNNSILKKRIMRRIYCVYYGKKLLSPIVIRFYLAAALLGGILSTVSVGNVYKNAISISSLNGFSSFSSFFSYAFMNTGLIVQILLIGAVAYSLFITRDLVRYRRPSRA